MPGRSMNGIGTRIYGKRDFLSDGSFITTKWITFLWVPLIPLTSMRVQPKSNGRMPDHFLASVVLAFTTGLLALRFSDNYVVRSTSRPVLPQVIYVYGFVLALFSAWWNLARSTNYINGAILIAVLLAPFVMRTIARSQADEVSQQFPD